MDDSDRKILNEIQSSFPIVSRPYREIGGKIGLSEEDVFERVEWLRKEGVIRRIGGSFHSRKLNFTSTLCAARVPEDKIGSFVETVGSYPGVTHNYLRNSTYNIWFTFIAPDMESIQRALDEISEKTGVQEILNLPAEKTYKIRVDFQV